MEKGNMWTAASSFFWSCSLAFSIFLIIGFLGVTSCVGCGVGAFQVIMTWLFS